MGCSDPRVHVKDSSPDLATRNAQLLELGFAPVRSTSVMFQELESREAGWRKVHKRRASTANREVLVKGKSPALDFSS